MALNITSDSVNRWRVVPRIIVMMYAINFYQVVHWFMGLKDPTNSQAMFVSTIVGAAAVFFGFYVNSGNTPPVNVSLQAPSVGGK